MNSEAAAAARMQPSQTVILVPRTEMSIRRFHGDGPAREIEEFLQNVERAWKSQHMVHPEEKCDFLFAHLGEAVKAELRCHPQTTRACPDALVQILRSTYGERRSINCLIGELFRISQHQYESVRAYSHRLLQAFEALTDRQRALSETPFSKSILRDQFVENLSDRILRRDLRERLLDRPETEFLALRDMAIRWAQDEDVAPQVNVTCREIKIEGQLAALSKQVEELAAQIVRLQFSGPQNYSCPHCNNHQPDHISSNVRQISSQPGRQPNRTLHHKRPTTKNRKCYTCGKPGHLARNCRLQNRFQGQRKKPGNRAHQQHPSRSNCSNCGSRDHFTRACPDVAAAVNHVQVASVEQPQAVQLQPAPKPTELSVEVPQNPRRSNTVPDSLVRRNQPAVAEMMSIHSEVASPDTSSNHAEGGRETNPFLQFHPVQPESTLLSHEVPELQKKRNDLLNIGCRVLVEQRVRGQGRMFMQYEPSCFIITAVPKYASGWYMVEAEDGSTYRYVREEEMKFVSSPY
ncbi:uncharacterized protein LOC106060942 [Biomphalaria glabrata]|uniref:Uncharacterized protein LOC106060942 n=1 Tax=Biomphalaria glabrata TaxID=6526 RepID=A0A9W2YU15_BIOGL|nr:uncharacterized protein LOC106060942 [Biomphalaria glabrata]